MTLSQSGWSSNVGQSVRKTIDNNILVSQSVWDMEYYVSSHLLLSLCGITYNITT